MSDQETDAPVSASASDPIAVLTARVERLEFMITSLHDFLVSQTSMPADPLAFTFEPAVPVVTPSGK